MKPQLALLIVVTVAAVPHAQAPEPLPTFEVASIRRLREEPNWGGGGMRPGGNYLATNLTVVQFVGSAYGVPSERVFGAPRWATTDRYEIRANASGNPTGAETTLMLQSLLRDRFKLAVRIERRDFPVFELKVARADGRL